jgi:hypothetical protein
LAVQEKGAILSFDELDEDFFGSKYSSPFIVAPSRPCSSENSFLAKPDLLSPRFVLKPGAILIIDKSYSYIDDPELCCCIIDLLF